MKQVISFAQKGLVLDRTGKKILVNKYLKANYLSEKLVGKFCLPGGQLEFGEDPDESFIREIKEETGVTIRPFLPFYVWTWVYPKGNIKKQIVAVARLALYGSGSIKPPKPEEETKLETAKWIKLSDVNIEDFVFDEKPAIEKFLEYKKRNPFLLATQ